MGSLLCLTVPSLGKVIAAKEAARLGRIVNGRPAEDRLKPSKSAQERHLRRRIAQIGIESLTRSARGPSPLTPQQSDELDRLIRELNELDAADVLDEDS
jgi:hypothetical protein